jgi:nitrilase
MESGAYVISAVQYVPASAYPASFPLPVPPGMDPVMPGGSCITDAEGERFLAGPLYGEEGILVADCDLRRPVGMKRVFDVAGHYSREDVLLPLLTADHASSNGRASSRP